MSRQPPSPPPDEAADPVWDLLDRPPRPEAPPFFTARVMRRITPLPQHGTVGWWTRLLRTPATPALVGAAALLLLFVGIRNPVQTGEAIGSPTPTPLSVLSTDRDLEVIAELDQLLAYEESATWLDSPSF